ncbi:MAG: imidazolonepropionase [Myxococcales bacterium]|nr:imidazolonepropionase [Myxococcales bacterium]
MVKMFINAHLATMSTERGYGEIAMGLLAVERDRIVYVGNKDKAPKYPEPKNVVDLEGRLVTPGLIDCHTHLIYAGSRAKEFESRQEGRSYEEITREGGGLFSTVKDTRAASEEALYQGAKARLQRLLREGITAVEIKSGYGLDTSTELRILRVATRLAKEQPVHIQRTFLGAHAIPQGMSAEDYISSVCIPTLRRAEAEGLVDAVDGFCEGIAFSPAQITQVFEVARELRLPIKLHADQLCDLGGASLAAQFHALSADHLEYTSSTAIRKMAQAGTIAVLLPGAYYCLNESKKPPITALRQAGVPMAVATDSNPGSSPMTSILLAMNLASHLFGLTPDECLRGTTVNAAKALGLSRMGRLLPGYQADFAIWDVESPAELTYRMGDAPLYQRVFGGIIC